ncbi:MAG: SDR family NAD(P)-dependent oxidoreductase [Balneolaceae bacterium]
MAQTEKHVWITGCSRGIGLSAAQRFLSEGWRVTGTHHRTPLPEELLRSPHFEGIQVDLSDIDALSSILKPQLTSPAPDVLINNAGLFTDASILSDDDDWLSVWHKTMQVNLLSASLLCKWYISEKAGSGSPGIILNIASRAAYRGDTEEYAAYAASKGGLTAFTKSIARGYSHKGIAAYTIAPGFVETDMARDAIALHGPEIVTHDSVLDTITQPDDVTELLLFLAQGTLRAATGSTFHINAGSYMI